MYSHVCSNFEASTRVCTASLSRSSLPPTFNSCSFCSSSVKHSFLFLYCILETRKKNGMLDSHFPHLILVTLALWSHALLLIVCSDVSNLFLFAETKWNKTPGLKVAQGKHIFCRANCWSPKFVHLPFVVRSCHLVQHTSE